MNNKKSEIEQILKHRFFVTPTGYPSQNGFLDYGPPLTQIRHQVIEEFRKVFVNETVFEIHPSAILPYEVLKNSGHIDKFCDVVISDSTNIYRADHFIEDKIGEIIDIPNMQEVSDVNSLKASISELKAKIISRKKGKNTNAEIEQFTKEEVDEILMNFSCVKKHLADFNKTEIDLVVLIHNFFSPQGLPFGPSRDFNLIFNLNDRQFLRPELAQSQFINFRKLFEMNNERLPFSSLCIGRSYRNEISARGGMLRTKEFEQAEIEYYTEDGSHADFYSIRDISVLILPNTCLDPFQTTLGDAFDTKVISSQAICYFIAKAQEFCMNIGVKLENLRYRQHNKNEMAHYANDCWDVEIKTFSGWVECAGIADRSNFDLTVHSKDVNTRVKRIVNAREVHDIVINKAEIGKRLKSKLKDLETYVLSIDQEFIAKNKQNDSIRIEFEGETYDFKLVKRIVDCEFFIPRVIEPSFGISRILYSLVEQSFKIGEERNILDLKPKMCYLHCVIGFLKYLEGFDPIVADLRSKLREYSIRFQVSERGCSIGRKYYSCDELGIPFFVTLDFKTLEDKKVTIRERNSSSQIRVNVSDAPDYINKLVTEEYDWASLMEQFGITN